MKDLICTKSICGAVVLAGAMLMNTAPAMAQDYGYVGGYNYAPEGQLDSLVSRIALYPDRSWPRSLPLLLFRIRLPRLPKARAGRLTRRSRR